ncbi:MAG TPA: hypothetical protein VM846_13735 [Vicinamibacterales bacterium]|nr:hypothetical protein [Vicinamibacterales bacterium]
MDGRPFRVRTVAAWSTVAAVMITVGSGSPAAKSPNASVPLHVLLTLSSNLTAMTRQALISEAERIWRHERVNIEWARPGHTVEHPDAPLRVLVVARPQMRRLAGEWPVAELFPEAAPRALAVASIESAERVVDEAARTAASDASTPRERRLGLVLGRAVAHEIGHFLLATGTHADSGLMRASVDAREFAAVNGEAFRLDRDASQWLRHRLAMMRSAVTDLRAEGFSYVRPPVLLEQVAN